MWSRLRSLLLKIKIQFPLNNFSLPWPIDTKLGACNQCNQNNGIIFLSLPSFIFCSCHINTWLNRWKPGFVALRRFLLKFETAAKSDQIKTANSGKVLNWYYHLCNCCFSFEVWEWNGNTEWWPRPDAGPRDIPGSGDRVLVRSAGGAWVPRGVCVRCRPSVTRCGRSGSYIYQLVEENIW